MNGIFNIIFMTHSCSFQKSASKPAVMRDVPRCVMWAIFPKLNHFWYLASN